MVKTNHYHIWHVDTDRLIAVKKTVAEVVDFMKKFMNGEKYLRYYELTFMDENGDHFACIFPKELKDFEPKYYDENGELLPF